MGKQLFKTSVAIEHYNPFYTLFFASNCTVLFVYAILRGLKLCIVCFNTLIISGIGVVFPIADSMRF